VTDKRFIVNDRTYRKPSETLVKRLKDAVVVFLQTLFLEAAENVNVRILVVPSVDVYKLWMLQLHG
jgi:hypothetical protein